MALELKVNKEEVQETCDSFVLNDETGNYDPTANPGGYGSPNAARSDRANVLFVTKTDVNGNRTLITITPDSNDPLAVASWSVPSDTDGWYEKLLASVTKHTVGQSYDSADIILYHSGVFYKTKSAVPVLTDPPNGTYFDVITAESLYTDELENESIDWAMLNELANCRAKDRIRDLHEEFADKFLSAKCDPNYISPADFLDGLLNSAQSELENDRPQEAERIIRGMETYYVNPA